MKIFADTTFLGERILQTPLTFTVTAQGWHLFLWIKYTPVFMHTCTIKWNPNPTWEISSVFLMKLIILRFWWSHQECLTLIMCFSLRSQIKMVLCWPVCSSLAQKHLWILCYPIIKVHYGTINHHLFSKLIWYPLIWINAHVCSHIIVSKKTLMHLMIHWQFHLQRFDFISEFEWMNEEFVFWCITVAKSRFCLIHYVFFQGLFRKC